MATSAQGFIAAATPAKLVRCSNTTLFELAARYLGDAQLWTAIAIQNQLVDPWIGGYAEIAIPPIVSQATPTGILSPTWPT
jgi:hypothetical protein